MSIVLVDASGYIYRAFYAQPPMQRSDGHPVGCIHGYCRMLWSLKKKFADASHFAIIHDGGKSAYRLEMFGAYKAGRAPLHDDLKAQLPLVREAGRAFGFPVIEIAGLEADDMIASYAEHAAERGDHVTIVSVDKDMFQLLRPGVEMYDPVKERILTTADVIAKLGVGPELAVDAQALIGDQADNVPGVPGIGPKIAGKLLAEFGSLDALLARWQQVTPAKIRDNIMFYAETVRLSRRLVTLQRDVPLPATLKEIEARFVDVERLIDFAESMEFISFAHDVRAFYGVPA